MRIHPTFWQRVLVGPADACWIWQGPRDRQGYGRCSGGHTRGSVLAHRAAFFLTHDYWPPVVSHLCHNPLCCNPAHLIDESQQANLARSREAGRHYHGEHHHWRKLTDAQRVEIVRLVASGVRVIEVAQRYGVARSRVYQLVRAAPTGSSRSSSAG